MTELSPRPTKAMLLDFNTIIDPVALLVSLVIFRHSHERLLVRGESLVYRYDFEDRSHPGMNFGRFDDRRALGIASYICKRSGDDLKLQPSNLCLAMRLLQHALSEGIVTILNDHLFGEWYGRDKVVPLDEIRSLPSFSYIDQNLYSGAKYDALILEPDTPGQRFQDLGMSLKQGWDVTLGGRTFSLDALIVDGKVKPQNLGQLKEYVRLLNADRFSVYTSLIDEPGVLRAVAEATRDVVEGQNYKNELRWFLPKYALDAASLGTYSLAEMLWLIIKKNLRQTREKRPNSADEADS
jgi:hypothetical protein